MKLKINNRYLVEVHDSKLPKNIIIKRAKRAIAELKKDAMPVKEENINSLRVWRAQEDIENPYGFDNQVALGKESEETNVKAGQSFHGYKTKDGNVWLYMGYAPKIQGARTNREVLVYKNAKTDEEIVLSDQRDYGLAKGEITIDQVIDNHWYMTMDEYLEKLKKPAEAQKRWGDSRCKDAVEGVKLICDIFDYSPWSGAVSFWEEIEAADKVDELDTILADMFPDGMTMTELNDLLWFDEGAVREWLGMDENTPEEDEDLDLDLSEEDLKDLDIEDSCKTEDRLPERAPFMETSITFSTPVKGGSKPTTIGKIREAAKKGPTTELEVLMEDVVKSIDDDIEHYGDKFTANSKESLRELIDQYTEIADIARNVKFDKIAKELDEKIIALENKLKTYKWKAPEFKEEDKIYESEKSRKERGVKKDSCEDADNSDEEFVNKIKENKLSKEEIIEGLRERADKEKWAKPLVSYYLIYKPEYKAKLDNAKNKYELARLIKEVMTNENIDTAGANKMLETTQKMSKYQDPRSYIYNSWLKLEGLQSPDAHRYKPEAHEDLDDACKKDSNVKSEWNVEFKGNQTPSSLKAAYVDAKAGIHEKLFEQMLENVVDDAFADYNRINNGNDNYLDYASVNVLNKIISYYEDASKYAKELGYKEQAEDLDTYIPVIKKAWGI